MKWKFQATENVVHIYIDEIHFNALAFVQIQCA